MWQPNRLPNYTFEDGTTNWTLDSGIVWDNTEILNDNISIKLDFDELVSETNSGMVSDRILVRPTEIYSASIYCRTGDYTLFDGNDPQVVLQLLGYETIGGASTVLGTTGINQNDFPAQDWFRLKIENITIPDNIHYIALKSYMKQNGKICFNYPSIEFGDTVTDYNPYNTDIMEYYNKIIYEDILEIQELTKAQDIEFNRLNRLTQKTSDNIYILTCDEDGLAIYEQQFGIIADPTIEDIDFRRDRLLNRFSILIPYTFPFLMNKFNELFGVGNWDAYIDFNNYTLYVEYITTNTLWSTEIAVTINNIKPANMIFRSVPRLNHQISVNESVRRYDADFNYKLDGTWQLGLEPFANLVDKGLIKMPNFPSVQQDYLDHFTEFGVNDVYKVKINDSYEITTFIVKNTSTGEISYQVPLSSGITEVNNIKLLDSSNVILTASNVYVPIIVDTLIKHSIILSEVLNGI